MEIKLYIPWIALSLRVPKSKIRWLVSGANYILYIVATISESDNSGDQDVDPDEDPIVGKWDNQCVELNVKSDIQLTITVKPLL